MKFMYKEEISTIKFGLHYLARYRVKLFLAILSSVLFVLIPMQIIVLTGTLLDSISGKAVSIYGIISIPTDPYNALTFLSLLMISLAICYGFIAYMRNITRALVTKKFIFELQKEMIQKIELFSLDIHTKFGAGELLNRSLIDVANTRSFVEDTVIKLVTNVIRVTYPLIFLFSINPFLAVISCSILPIQFLLTKKFQSKIHEILKKNKRKRDKLMTYLKESYDGIETIHTFNAQDYTIKKITRQVEKIESDQIKSQKYYGFMTGSVWALTSIGLAITWWQGGLFVLNGYMSIGELVVFTGFVVFAYSPFRRFVEVMKYHHKSILAVENIKEILDLSSSIEEKSHANDLCVTKGDIVFKNVSFSYPRQEKFVLKNISLRFGNGIYTIIGKNGSGKSSILRLIPRMYDPKIGEIMIDNHDIKTVKLSSLRSQIGIVPQNPIIFSGTVVENISLSKPDATMKEIKDVCSRVNSLDFINALENKFETRLGRKGISLSGGQIQKIAIARALLKKPKILLLDEPNSALDYETEIEIYKILQKLKETITIIIVAHNLTFLGKISDKIIIVDEGSVIESGSHEELLKSSSLYNTNYGSNINHKMSN